MTPAQPTLLLAEHGNSSMTYDFTYVSTLTDDTNKILRIIPGGRLAHSILKLAYGAGRLVYYGHSYEARDNLNEALRKKRIILRGVKVTEPY